MPLPDTGIATLVIALYGAILSTILAIKELLKERKTLQVTCGLAVAPTASASGDVADYISIRAINVGHRPIEIRFAGLLMSNHHAFTQIRSNAGPIPLPKKLDDGDSVDILLDAKKAYEALAEFDRSSVHYTKAIVRDASGREYSANVPKYIQSGSKSL